MLAIAASSGRPDRATARRADDHEEDGEVEDLSGRSFRGRLQPHCRTYRFFFTGKRSVGSVVGECVETGAASEAGGEKWVVLPQNVAGCSQGTLVIAHPDAGPSGGRVVGRPSLLNLEMSRLSWNALKES